MLLETELYNLPAEYAVISALIFGGRKEFEQFLPEDFYSSEVRECFNAARILLSDGKTLDLANMFQLLSSKARELLAYLAAEFISDSGYAAHKEAVIDCAQRRALSELLEKAAKRVFDFSARAGETVLFLEEALQKISQRVCSGEVCSVQELMPVFYEMIEARQKNKGTPGISTGFESLDFVTGGLLAGNLYVLAARPGMGKSAFASAIALSAAQSGHSVLFFSLEMARELVLQRMAAAFCGIENNRLKTGKLRFQDWELLSRKGLGSLAGLPLYIDDRAGISADEVTYTALSLSASKNGLGLVVVDYLQIMQGEGKDRRMVVEDNCRKMKILAKRLSCPVLLLSQLNRAAEVSGDKRPALWQLRESGAIEQDADLVAFLYRDSYYNKDAPAGETEVIIAKQRDGALATVKIEFQPEYTAFREQGFQTEKTELSWEDIQ